MNERWFRDKDVKHIWARVIEQKPDGWCVVTFDHKTMHPMFYNYHIAYLQAFYEEQPLEA